MGKFDNININDLFETTDNSPYTRIAKSYGDADEMDFNIFKRASFDIDAILRDCVFIYLFDVLAGGRRVSYVRDILCKSGVNLDDLKQKVMNIDYKERGAYFKSFYTHAEDMFYEDVALSVSELVKDNKYIVKSILDMGVNGNKESVEIGEIYINFYNSNKDFIQKAINFYNSDKDFIQKTYETFCTDDMGERNTSKLRDLSFMLLAIKSFSVDCISDFLRGGKPNGSLEKVGYLFLMLVYNMDVSNGFSQNTLLSYIRDTLSTLLKGLKENRLFKSISYYLDEKISWYDGNIFDSNYIARCINRWTDEMMEVIKKHKNQVIYLTVR